MMSAIISPKNYISAVEKSPAIIKPNVYISAVIKSPAIVAPKIYVSAIEKSPAILAPKIYISAVSKNPAIVLPKVFISVIDLREKVVADTLRKVTNRIVETAYADTLRGLREKATADTLREVVRIEKAIADTVIRYPYVLNFLAQDSLINTFKDYDLTLFEVTLNERTLSDSFTIETPQDIKINDAVKGTFLDYPFSFLVEETTRQNLISTVKGMYDIDKLLYTYFKFEISTFENKVYPTTRVTSATSSSSSSSEYTHKSTYIRIIESGYESYIKAADYVDKCAEYFGFTANSNFDNFTPTNIDDDTDITYADLISSLFSWTSKLPQRQINVFIRGGTLHCIQRGKENSVFDISDIPHSRPIINKKIVRTMYNTPTDKEFTNISVISGGDIGGGTTIIPYPEEPEEPEEPLDPEFLDEEYEVPFSGQLSYSDDDEKTWLAYSSGLLIQEGSNIKNVDETGKKITASQITNYKYLGYDGDYYLSYKKVQNTTTKEKEEKTVTTTTTKYKYLYTYDDIYLAKETEICITEEYQWSDDKWKLTDTEEHTRTTYHHPLGDSFYSTSLYVDGEIQGSSISQGKSGNKVSLYTQTQTSRSLKPNNNTPANNGGGDSGGGDSGSGSNGDSGNSDKDYIDNPSTLSPINDVSFPVREAELQLELQQAYIWLNRKIQVTVDLNLISKIENGVPDLKHIVDFTERVKLDGTEYFLVSNTVTFTPRSLIQKLQLVRWKE